MPGYQTTNSDVLSLTNLQVSEHNFLLLGKTKHIPKTGDLQDCVSYIITHAHFHIEFTIVVT